MKLKLALCFILALPSLSLATNVANYCLEGKLVNTKTNIEKSSMKCQVAQKLTWEDYSVLFECDFDGTTDSIFSSATGIGSDLGTTGWTIYDLKKSESGQFLAKGLKLSEIKKSQDIKIMYNSKVWANDDFVVIETKDGIFKLNLNAYLGKCN